MTTVVTIESRHAPRDEEARDLAEQLGLQLRTDGGRVPDGELRLILLEGVIEVWDHDCVRRGTRIDFSNIDVRTGPGNLSRKQPLAKAMGRHDNSILDATAGFGHDAFLLACMGFHVLAVERVPVIHLLLKEAVDRAMGDPVLSSALGNRLRVIHGEAVEAMQSLSEPPDVIYLDPMFQKPVNASALPKRRAQLLRLIVGGDQDAEAVLDVALETARQHVVVKRSADAEPLVSNPDISFPGKIARYDVYRA
jgi:16S rRNA (guanine1516-N2)-methyltransferase